MSKREERLSQETLKIIKAGGRILLKGRNGWYLHAHTNIAAGPDQAVWGKREVALEMFNLHWAHTIAPLYDTRVVIVYPQKKETSQVQLPDDSIPMGGHTCACQALK